MNAQVDWTGWVLGDIRFAPRTIERWKAHSMAPGRHADWPTWIRPGPVAEVSVAAELSAIQALARERERSPVPPADLISLTWEPSRLRIRAHLGPAMFDLWGGQLAALARSVERVGAQGEVLFLERPSNQGHRLRLDGKGPGRFDPVDDTSLARWGDPLEQMAALLSSETGPLHRCADPPLRELHLSLGGHFGEGAAWALPDHYGRGPDDEMGLLHGGLAVVDACGLSAVRVRGRGAKELLVQGGMGGLAKAWRARVAWGELRDGVANAMVDRVLGWKHGSDGTLLFGSPERTLHLAGFLRRHASSRVSIEDESPRWGGVVFAGPEATARLAGLGGKKVSKLAPGRVCVPVPWGTEGALLHAPLGGHDLWMVVTEQATAADLLRAHAPHLCGAGVWRHLHEAAGEVPPVGMPRRAVSGPRPSPRAAAPGG